MKKTSPKLPKKITIRRKAVPKRDIKMHIKQFQTKNIIRGGL